MPVRPSREPVLLTIAAAQALVATLLAGPASGLDAQVADTLGPSERRGPLTLTPIRFERREETPTPTPESVQAEEGRLRVPLWHDRASPDSIEIHFVRFAATAASPGPPIVYLAGGPGGSGTLSAAGDRFGLFLALRTAGDVIALDQRGTFGSDPYPVCPGSFDLPLETPTDTVSLSAAMGPFLARCWSAWEDSVDLAAFNTVQSAEDLDDLREALGAERLVLWGISYGTHLALVYIRRHPERVERAILAGVEGPDHTWKLPSNLDRVLLRVDSAVRADPRTRETVPDLAGGLRAAVQELEREPARARLTADGGEEREVVVGALDLQRAAFGMLGEREDIVELPLRAAPILEGDFSGLARLAAQGRQGNRVLAMSLSMDCASGVTPARRTRIDQEAPLALLGDAGNVFLRAACPHWPVSDLGEQFRSPVRADVPVLFISGTLDARTPPINAEEVMAGFPRGRHLLIEGGSHDDDLFLSSPAILEAMKAFLAGRSADVPERVPLSPLRFRVPERRGS